MSNQKVIIEKKTSIYEKFVIGIDPAKVYHQAAVLDKKGFLVGKSFPFKNSRPGFEDMLIKARKRIPEITKDNTVIAIETSCNLWQVPLEYFKNQGFQVLLVSPLTTKHSRPLASHEFSHTDPKDAWLVADNAKKGNFDYFRLFDDKIIAMHKLSITYDKLRKNYVQDSNRIHALVDRVFPEFFNVLAIDQKTAIYLLEKYMLPKDFINMNIVIEKENIRKVSKNKIADNTLNYLKAEAKNSIGIVMQEHEAFAERMNLTIWLKRLTMAKEQMELVIDKIIDYAKQTPYFEILISLKGISVKMAALFIAEIKDLGQFKHYKQLEKHAGYSLRLFDSGKYKGMRHMNHIGNKRLSWILYKMSEETAKYIPEVRVKFLKRQIIQRKYRKTIIACSSNLLKLIMALIRDNRTYDFAYYNGCYERMLVLEKKYLQTKDGYKTKRYKAA